MDCTGGLWIQDKVYVAGSPQCSAPVVHPTLLTQGLHPEVAGLSEQRPADDDLLGCVERVPHDQGDACWVSTGSAQGSEPP